MFGRQTFLLLDSPLSTWCPELPSSILLKSPFCFGGILFSLFFLVQFNYIICKKKREFDILQIHSSSEEKNWLLGVLGNRAVNLAKLPKTS